MTNSQNIDPHPWKISETVKIYLLTQVSVALLYLFMIYAFDVSYRNPYLIAGFVIFSSLTLFFSIVYIIKDKYKLSAKVALNLHISKPFNLWVYALIGIFMAVIFKVSIPKLSTVHSYTSQFITTNLAFAIALFNGVFIAPVCEEIFWRGFVYPVVKKRFSLIITILIISSLVTLVHFPDLGGMWDALIKVLLGNVIFVLLRYRTNSTLSCIITHISYNAAIIVIPLIKHLLK